MKNKFRLLTLIFFLAAAAHAQLVPAGKGILRAAAEETAGKTAVQTVALQGKVAAAVRSAVANGAADGGLVSASHILHVESPAKSVSFLPQINEENLALAARIPLADIRNWARMTREDQLKLAALSNVPAALRAQVSPSLAQIFLVGRADNFIANGFIVNYNGTNWVALSYHVGGKIGNERLVKIILNDGSEVSFDGAVEAAGNAGYHEADLALIRIPEAWQGQVTPLQVAAPQPDLPIYSFGSVAEDSRHGDFLPVKRAILGQSGTSIRMTHEIAGEDSTHILGMSGYCGSPLVQETAEGLRVVGIFTGHVDAVGDFPAMAYAVDLSQTLPVIVDDPHRLRTLKFLGQPVGRVAVGERLEQISLWRGGLAPDNMVTVRQMYHFPQAFSYEQAELALSDTELHSGDVVGFGIRGHQRGFFFLQYTIP